MGQRSSVFILLGLLTVELKMKPVLNIWAINKSPPARPIQGMVQRAEHLMGFFSGITKRFTV